LHPLTNGRQLIAKAPTEKKTNTTEDVNKTEPDQSELCLPRNSRLELISKALANTNTNEYAGDAFIVDRHHARQALDLDDDKHLGEIWLTIRKKVLDAINEKNISFLDKKRRAFITIWISEVLGEELSKRGRPFPMVDCTSNEEVQPTNNGKINVSV
jgi:hypothetical protein